MTFDLAFDLQGQLQVQMPGQRSWLCKLLNEAGYRLRPFWYTCYVLLGGCQVARHLTLTLTLQVKCQVKPNGYVSCPGRLAVD